MNTTPSQPTCSSCGGLCWITDEMLVDAILDANPALIGKPICQGCLMRADTMGTVTTAAIAQGTTVPQMLRGILDDYSN